MQKFYEHVIRDFSKYLLEAKMDRTYREYINEESNPHMGPLMMITTTTASSGLEQQCCTVHHLVSSTFVSLSLLFAPVRN